MRRDQWRVTLVALLTACAVSPVAWSQTVLYDNGPVFDSPGTGAAGADESVLQNLTLGDQDYGASHGPVPFNDRVADDFTIADPGGWQIASVILFAYQENLSTVSTLTAVNLRIWNGPPGEPGSSVVFGDTTTNRLTSSTFAGVYRVSESTSGAGNRAVMSNRVAVNATLPPGTYWLDWQTEGSLPGGPFAPPVVRTGVAVTGDARWYTESAGPGAWSALVDSASGNAKGLPFVVEGAADLPTGAVPALDEVGIAVFVMLLMAAAVWLLRGRP